MKNNSKGETAMRTALTEAPKICTCGRKLKKPVYGSTDASPVYHYEPRWHIECLCGNVWIWAFPDIYRKSHILPLGRSLYGY
jgi:hypothetical protein